MSIRRLVYIGAAVAIIVVPVAASSAGVGDRSSGQGYWSGNNNNPGQPGTTTGGSIGYEALGTLPDAVGSQGEGQFDFRRQDGSGFHARVTCLRVEGNEAFIGLLATDGSMWEAYAQDNNNGSGNRPGAQDLFNLIESDNDCDDDARDGASRVFGDIDNVDGG